MRARVRTTPRFQLRLLFAPAITACLVGCDEGVTAPQGVVRGVVQVEGTVQEGVTIELSGPQSRSTTTDAAGQYTFSEVASGAYVVSVLEAPEDASFPATSRTAVVSGSQTVSVDFLGNFIRTASIEGTVTSGSQGVAGATVTLRGAESGTTVTGPAGSFLFSSLRAGSYEVEISDLPASVTFPSVRTDVDLSVGQRFLVTFVGIPELTASVVVRSIERRTEQGGLELADLQNLRGQIEVTLTVDRGEDTLESVELLVGNEVVGQQIFGGGGGGPAPPSTAPFDVVFPVPTSEFDALTGAPRFLNGPRLLTARLATLEGGASAWLSSVQVQFRNVNTFAGSILPANGPLLGEDGEEWIGGSIQATVRPVLYDTSRDVSTITVDLRREGGGQLRAKSSGGSAPFVVVFEDGGTPGGDNVTAYQTPLGATDQLRVVSASYEDASSVPGVPAVLGAQLRIDNLAPPTAVFELPRQGLDQDCCLSNWVGAAFAFGSGLTLQPDGGVGDLQASVHAGAASMTDVELAELPPVLVGSDLPTTIDNASLRAVAVVRDGLGNERRVPLQPSEGNPLSNALGAVFGIDLALPQAAFGAGGVPDRAINPAMGTAWVLQATDTKSGIGGTPARSIVRLRAPGVVGTPGECVFPAAFPCGPIPDGLVRPLPAGVEGYLTFESVVLDRSGNRSNVVSRTALVDGTAPAVTSMQLPGTLIPNGQTEVSAIVSDNLDLHRGWIGLEFAPPSGGAGEILPLAAPLALGAPFVGDLTTGGSVAQTFPLAVGIERVVAVGGVDEPSGAPLTLAAARSVVRDAAENLTTRTEALAGVGGLSPVSFSAAARGDEGGVRDWRLTADAAQVCREGDEAACEPAIPGTIRLTAKAAGLGGVLQRPFDGVYFLVVRDGEPERVAVVAVAQMIDGIGPLAREWFWELDWAPPSDFPLGVAELVAVGADADGNTLRTLSLTTVTVEGGP